MKTKAALLVVSVFCCCVGVFLIAPEYIKSQAQALMLNKYGVKLNIGEVSLYPLSLKLALHNVEVLDLNQSDMLSIDEIDVKLRIKDIINKNISEIVVRNPNVYISLDDNNISNIAKIFQTKHAKSDGLDIKNLVVIGAKINFASNFLNFNAADINLNAANLMSNTVVDANASIDRAHILINAEKMQDGINVKLDVNALDMHKFLEKITPNLKQALIDANISFNLRKNDLNITNSSIKAKNIEFLANNSAFSAKQVDIYINNFALKQKNFDLKTVKILDFKLANLQTDILAAKNVEVLNILKTDKALDIDLINVNSPTAYIQILDDKSTNLHKLFAKQDNAKPIKIDIKAMATQDGLMIINNKNDKFILNNIDINASGSSDKNRFSANAKCNVFEKGVILANMIGNVKDYDARINLQNIPLEPLTPYVKPFASLDIKDGALDANISAQNSKIQTDALISSVRLDANNTKLLSVDKISVSKALWNNQKLTVSDVLIQKPVFDFWIYKDKNTSLSGVFKHVKSNEQSGSFDFLIVKTRMTDGILNFRDDSLPIKFKTSVNSLQGRLLALSPNKQVPITVKLKGEIGKYGFAEIDASLSAGSIFKNSDVSLDFSNVDVKTLSPYVIEFFGYEVDGGKIWLDLDYKINDFNLTSSNKITLKDFRLGELVDENKSKLPLRLAIGLLEDSDGEINFSIPVSGNVDSPKFELKDAVKDAILTSILNVLSSPLRLFANILDLDDDGNAIVYFEYGKYRLTPPQKEELDKLIDILKQKPELNVDILAAYDALQDKQVLAARRFEQKMLRIYEQYDFGMSKFEFIKKEFIKQYGIQKYDELQTGYDDKSEKDREFLYKIMLNKMINDEPIEQSTLTELAHKRAKEIKSYLMQSISSDRLSIGNVVQKSGNNEEVGVELKVFIKE